MIEQVVEFASAFKFASQEKHRQIVGPQAKFSAVDQSLLVKFVQNAGNLEPLNWKQMIFITATFVKPAKTSSVFESVRGENYRKTIKLHKKHGFWEKNFRLCVAKNAFFAFRGNFSEGNEKGFWAKNFRKGCQNCISFVQKFFVGEDFYENFNVKNLFWFEQKINGF